MPVLGVSTGAGNGSGAGVAAWAAGVGEGSAGAEVSPTAPAAADPARSAAAISKIASRLPAEASGLNKRMWW